METLLESTEINESAGPEDDGWGHYSFVREDRGAVRVIPPWATPVYQLSGMPLPIYHCNDWNPLFHLPTPNCRCSLQLAEKPSRLRRVIKFLLRV